MKAVSLPSGTMTRVATQGHRDFVHIKNGDAAATVLICYDGDRSWPVQLAAGPVDTSGGFPLYPGEVIQLNNDGVKPIFNKEIWAYQASGVAVTIYLQGVDSTE